MRLQKLTFILFFIAFSFQFSVAQTIEKDSIDIVLFENEIIPETEENDIKVAELGAYIENAIYENKTNDFISKMDLEAFAKKVTTNEETLEQEEGSYKKGFVNGFMQTMYLFPKKLISEVENGSFYNFINYRYEQETQSYHMLFRLFSVEGGINYHDYKVCLVNDDIGFDDMYIYLSGEMLSETLARMYTYSKPQKKLFGLINTNSSRDFENATRAFALNKLGRYKESYAILDSLNGDLGKEKFLLIIKTLVASNIDDETYKAALTELIETFPDDPTIYLNQIDYHFYNGEFYEAFELVNKLQNITEDDFLNYLKASLAFEDKNYDVALNFFKYIIDNYEGFFEAQAGYLNTLIMKNNYEEAVSYLDTLIAEEGYDKKDLATYIEEKDEFGINILEDFSKSKIFKKWKRSKN